MKLILNGEINELNGETNELNGEINELKFRLHTGPYSSACDNAMAYTVTNILQYFYICFIASNFTSTCCIRNNLQTRLTGQAKILV